MIPAGGAATAPNSLAESAIGRAWAICTPDVLLDQYERYIDMTPEQRDREIQLVCRTAMNQWLALPADKRIRWPLEPGPAGEEILRRWMEEFRAR